MPAPTRQKHAANIAKKLVSLVQQELRQAADPQEAKIMQGYVKSDMPMYGIQRPARAAIEKTMYGFLSSQEQQEQEQEQQTTTSQEDKPKKKKRKKAFLSQDLYQTCVETLWKLPHREEKYLAIDLALKYKDCINPLECLDMYEDMLRQDFMWWDLVDPIAINLVGKGTALHHPKEMEPRLKRWIHDDNMWIRRTAILTQLKFKEQTNEALLLDFCSQRMHEKEFFVRKAIGWALREYSKTHPNVVKSFLLQNKADLSGLSFREGAKILVKQGKMQNSSSTHIA